MGLAITTARIIWSSRPPFPWKHWFAGALNSPARLTYSGTPLGTFQAMTTYTVTMAVGVPVRANDSPLTSIHLTANATDIATASVDWVPRDTWQTITATLATGTNPAYDGQTIGLYIESINHPGTNGVVNLDHVHLQIVPPYQTRAAGIQGFSDTDPSHDPDGDGLTKQQEFAIGLDPTRSSSANPIRVPLDRTTGTFHNTRPGPTTSGLSYVVYTSPDLRGWAVDGGATESVISTDAITRVQSVEGTLIGDKPLVGSKLFVRVAAE